MSTIPDLTGLLSFAATAASLTLYLAAVIRARLAEPIHGDFSRLSRGL